MAKMLEGTQQFADAAKTAKRLIRPLKKELIALLQELVRTDSVALPPESGMRTDPTVRPLPSSTREVER